MTTIKEIIQREVNPFDPVTLKTGNFWREEQQVWQSGVASIHQEIITQVTQILDLVVGDQQTRSLLLAGDQGSGKSYLLGRLKQNLNKKAFFAYISPCSDHNYLWRHILRQCVDSLMYQPQGQRESQLILWLKGLSVFNRTPKEQLLGQRGLFILNMRSIYPVGIYRAKEFFGVLYDLIQPDLYPLACDWLRGENLDDEELKALGVQGAIDSEETARNFLANLGIVATSTQPIVLCFDQVELAPKRSDGSLDLEPLFGVNTTFHNEKLHNFLLILSITTDDWRTNKKNIPQSDLARIEQFLALKAINLKQAQALWANRLAPLHAQAEPQPQSPIAPLSYQALEEKFPGGKTTPRLALNLASQLFQAYKLDSPSPETNPLAEFKLLWHQEFKQTQQQVSRLRQFASLELSAMLRKVIATLSEQEIPPTFLPSPKYSSYSFAYYHLQLGIKVGVLWTEEPNLTSFFHAMRACQKAVEHNMCQRLYLLRAEGVGASHHKGNQIYQQIFTHSSHQHLQTNLNFLHYLVTYNRLANSALAGELVIARQVTSFSGLEKLLREADVFADCALVQFLLTDTASVSATQSTEHKIKDFLLDVVKTQQLMGRQILVQNALHQFPTQDEEHLEQLIEQLSQEQQIRILDHGRDSKAQLVCLVQ